MIMIKDNQTQTVHSLKIRDIEVNEGQLVFKTEGRYRLLNLGADETNAVKAALEEIKNDEPS